MSRGRNLVLALAAVIAVLATVLTLSGTAAAQTVRLADITTRDRLIFNQESLLNVYRCRFSIDTHIVPGGCRNRAPARPAPRPGVFTGTPTAAEVAARDSLVAAQESLLNVYRCRFSIDTHIVPGGCQSTMPGPQPTPTRQPGPEAPTAAQIYESLAPSIPLVETPSGHGSGILIEGGYVVTNYHVVGFHDEVWVVFPDGTEFEGVPVLAYDFMADLAVLGPISFNAPALELADGEEMMPGSDLYLIGYPAEYDLFPQATITKGILSRFRHWDIYDLTLIQTDAAIAGGQSGGALVNNRGEIVGISTWRFSEAGFGVATSAADDAEIVEELIQLAAAEKFESNRRITTRQGEFAREVDATLARAFTFEGSAGTGVSISIEGEANGAIRISDASGMLLEADETETGKERATFEVLRDGLHFVEIYSARNEDGDYRFDLTSSVRLKPYEDPDDGRELMAYTDSDIEYGLFDYYSDIDWYTIQLSAGETIRLQTDSIIADSTITILSSRGDSRAFDDNSGPISALPNSLNAMIEYTAPASGEYFILIEEARQRRGAGYALIIERIG